ncbi:M20/M25/M40 family metallo-hydrolase [Actinomadura syzygii]|uniref:M20/M25/M40 family metallo-hydrolase n=2 Tax=Actinomadura syzygii TaxID=1427538 RepID=A0A5D0U9H8_9ACTN|nr:M20/M25/M40 family metallo-hydrolase [Actinomadura syzygii]
MAAHRLPLQDRGADRLLRPVITDPSGRHGLRGRTELTGDRHSRGVPDHRHDPGVHAVHSWVTANDDPTSGLVTRARLHQTGVLAPSPKAGSCMSSGTFKRYVHRAGTLATAVLMTVTSVIGTSAAREQPLRGDAQAEHLAGMVNFRRAQNHLAALEAAADRGGGSRAPGTRGFELSQAYVRKQLRNAGYEVQEQSFSFLFTQDLDARYQYPGTGEEVKIKTINFTPSTPTEGLEGTVVPVPVNGAPGCAPSDYSNLPIKGAIALVRRGGCRFTDKQKIAAGAGASAVLFYNDQPGLLYASLATPEDGLIPSGAMTAAQGEELARRAGEGTLQIRLFLRQLVENRTTSNLIAETRAGDPSHVLMVGAHLDSVPEGPGINDNGSGAAGTLELALAMARSHNPPSEKVRFAWWSAEEWGQIGSESYLKTIPAEQKAKISGYIDLSKLGSPNYIRGYLDPTDEDHSGGPVGAPGSAELQTALKRGLTRSGKPAIPLDLNGSRQADWVSFFDQSIPVAGLFSGSEGDKTAHEADLFGGEPGKPYDPCQHTPCDRTTNINQQIFGQNIRAAAYALGLLTSSGAHK